MKTISILGSGWLGYKLAKYLKSDFQVRLALRDESKKAKLEKEGFDTFILNENELKNLESLLECEYLFINYPPSKFEDYLGFLNKIYSHKKIKNIKKIFFISSTSIYPNTSNVFKENHKIVNPISKNVFDAENLVKEKTHVIFRCSGLMGYDRIAGKYFSGKSLDSKDVKVNYVHANDVLKATLFAIKKDLEGVYNLCSSFHPSREEVYLSNAIKYNFEKPAFENTKKYEERIIDGSKICERGFEYDYSNPLKYD